MYAISRKPARVVMNIAIALLGFFAAQPGFAQSLSDDQYASALEGMMGDMDLGGLADQTFETLTVVAPQLPELAPRTNMAACADLQAQAEAAGYPIEIFGADAAMSESDRAALSACLAPESGLVLGYLAPQN